MKALRVAHARGLTLLARTRTNGSNNTRTAALHARLVRGPQRDGCCVFKHRVPRRTLDRPKLALAQQRAASGCHRLRSESYEEARVSAPLTSAKALRGGSHRRSSKRCVRLAAVTTQR